MRLFFIFISLYLINLIQTSDTSQNLEPISKVTLGEKLFFDPLLSRDQSISCGSCHRPEFAFADTVAFSLGVKDSLGIRNTPSVMNMAFRPYFFYDGRAASLEEQILVPIESSIEMHLDYNIAVERIQEAPVYYTLFQMVYQSPPDSANILNAIALFISSLESDGSAPHDQWIHGNEEALTPAQVRGRAVFLEKGKCFDCHFGPDFTGDEFRNIGLYDGVDWLDKGRFEISKDSADLGTFKVPGLRNVALTAPYMHNGQFQTLEEVVEYYDDPSSIVKTPINMDTLMREPLKLTDEEKSDLVEFLHSLTDVF